MTKEQFEERAMALADTMYRVSSTLLRRPPDRHDAIQSALVHAFEHRARLRDPARFDAWLLRILVNECYTLLRKNRRLVLAEAMPEAVQPSPDPFLRDAIMALPEHVRLPFVLHYAEGLHIAEVAQVLRIPPGTVKSRLSRARTLLQKALEEV